MFRRTLIAAALATATLATATLAAGTTDASAANLNNAITVEAPQASGGAATVETAGFKFKKNFKFKKRFYFKKKFHGGYGYKCRWLKKKAHITGSRHWWSKYQRCMYRYYR